MKKKVYIWADADKRIGFGHFTRSLALADMLKSDFDCVFFTQAPSSYQIGEVKKVCKLCPLPNNDRKFDRFLSYLTGSEIVVLDNYFFTSEYQKAVKATGCKLVTLGSNDRHYYSDIVINYTNLKPEQFSTEPYTRICIGLRWVVLRRAFYNPNRTQPKPHTYVICIGGTDQCCYLEQFAAFIKAYDPNALINIIATERIGASRIADFRQQGYALHINLSAEQMVQVFRTTNISVVSASSVALEALSQDSNVIAGYYVDNQVNIYNSLVDEDFIWPLGDFSDADVLLRMEEAIKQIHEGKRKRTCSSFNTIADYRQLFLSL